MLRISDVPLFTKHIVVTMTLCSWQLTFTFLFDDDSVTDPEVYGMGDIAFAKVGYR